MGPGVGVRMTAEPVAGPGAPALVLPGATTVADVVAVSASSGRELGHLALQVGLAVGSLLERAAATVDLVPSDLRALYALDVLGPLSAGQLARQLMVQQSCVTLLAGRLEQKRLLLRRRDQVDRRRVVLQIDEPGRSLVGEVAVGLRHDLRRFFAPLSPGAAAQLADLLDDVIGPWMGGAAPRPAPDPR